MSIGRTLKELRVRRNWNQEYVARLMTVDRSTISRYENDEILPSYDTIAKFAQVYQVHKDILLRELDQNKNGLPIILKENPDDQDFELIRQLVHETPSLKEALLDMYSLNQPKRNTAAVTIRAFVKEFKRQK
ncbi:helix-turn-helix domain-containing protein [Robertmurraya mangrovi]|nr:helix-turn-helix transcriptional regulator [Bacillus sp. 31A1R]